jgi:hypothetical protein
MVEALLDLEHGLLLLVVYVDQVDLILPFLVVLLDEIVHLLLESHRLLAQVSTLVGVEVVTEDFLDAALVDVDFLLDLRCPGDIVRHGGDVA